MCRKARADGDATKTPVTTPHASGPNGDRPSVISFLLMRGRQHRLGLAVVLAIGSLAASTAAAPTWSFHGPVVEGGQLDAVAGPGDRVHVVSSRYYQLDENAAVLVDEAQGDDRQGALDFPPAIAVGDDGSAHIVTRHGGDWTSGHDIRYRRRNAQGSWDRDYLVGSPVTRNYVVGVAWADASNVYLASTQAGANVWGDVHLFSAGASAATLVGDLSGIWRGDTDCRLRGDGGRVALVSGLTDPDGTAFFASASAGAGLVAGLQAALHGHTAGSGRRGFPDLYVDGSGDVHMSYAALHQVYYARHDAQGNELLGSDRLVFDDLGDWHMSTGLSAVAGQGDVVVSVALRSDGSQGAEDSDLLWAYSTDGGASWSAPEDLGVNTNGGEGRRRPRLVFVGGTFMLLYWDNASSSIAAATVVVSEDGDSDGFGADEDCDDANDAIYPGAEEICNGVDDDCDGDTDEGCGGLPDGGVPADAGPGGGGAQGVGGSSAGGSSATQADAGGLQGNCGCTLPGGGSRDPARPLGVAALALLAGLRRRRDG